jgi:hypothetical protein
MVLMVDQASRENGHVQPHQDVIRDTMSGLDAIVLILMGWEFSGWIAWVAMYRRQLPLDSEVLPDPTE